MHWSDPEIQETELHLSNHEAHYLHFKEWRICLEAVVRVAEKNVWLSQHISPEGDKNRFTSMQQMEMDRQLGLLGDAEEALERYDGVHLGFKRRFFAEEALAQATIQSELDDLYDIATLDGVVLDAHLNPRGTQTEELAS